LMRLVVGDLPGDGVGRLRPPTAPRSAFALVDVKMPAREVTEGAAADD